MEGKEIQVAGGYVEITFTLPRLQAREVARRYLDRYPKQGYDTHVSSWYETTNGEINFTMRRLPNCD